MDNLFKKIYFNDNLKQKLIEYLLTKNVNIDWENILNKYISKNDIDILKQIKNKIWIDKSEEYYIENNIMEYYTTLINKYNLYDKNIIIMDIKNILSENLNNILIEKINSLKTLLNIYNFKYSISTDIKIIRKYDFIIPVASLTYNQQELNSLNKEKLIIDNYFSICIDSEYIYLYNLIHLIENYLYDDNTEKYDYEYIFLN